MTIRQHIIEDLVFFRMFCQWKRLAKRVVKSDYISPSSPSLVIVPCDPWSVGGSRGDEAMITGVINYYRNTNPDIPIRIICADDGLEYINNLPIAGITPISSWNGSYSTEQVYTSIINVHPSDVVILGADCMDGYYSPLTSLELLSIYDLCCKTPNLRSKLLGFSFCNFFNRYFSCMFYYFSYIINS